MRDRFQSGDAVTWTASVGSPTLASGATRASRIGGGTQRTDFDSGTPAGPIQHTVVFRLHHPPGSAAAGRFLHDARQLLSALPTVQRFTVARQVSAKSPFEYQFSMVFDDQAAYDAYDEHPVHRRFVEERWATEVADFQEYDFVAIEPADR